jgi:hypothetical protein
LHLEHERVGILSNLGEDPFEVCEEGWVIKRPFGRFLMGAVSQSTILMSPTGHLAGIKKS